MKIGGTSDNIFGHARRINGNIVVYDSLEHRTEKQREIDYDEKIRFGSLYILQRGKGAIERRRASFTQHSFSTSPG